MINLIQLITLFFPQDNSNNTFFFSKKKASSKKTNDWTFCTKAFWQTFTLHNDTFVVGIGRKKKKKCTNRIPWKTPLKHALYKLHNKYNACYRDAFHEIRLVYYKQNPNMWKPTKQPWVKCQKNQIQFYLPGEISINKFLLKPRLNQCNVHHPQPVAYIHCLLSISNCKADTSQILK